MAQLPADYSAANYIEDIKTVRENTIPAGAGGMVDEPTWSDAAWLRSTAYRRVREYEKVHHIAPVKLTYDNTLK